jgi:alpha-mannosidase
LASALGSPGSVVDEAEGFNLRLRPVPVPATAAAEASGAGSSLPPRASVVEVDGAMVSSIKRADDNDDVIVRLFEPAGSHGQARVRLGHGGLSPIAAAACTDALERELYAAEVGAAGDVELELRPFELVTLKLTEG